MSGEPQHRSVRTAQGLAASRAGAAAAGLAIIGALAAVDAAGSPGTMIIGTVVLAPFVVSLLAGPRETAVVAAVALVVVVVSGVWNHNFDAGAYYLRVVVVLVGGAVAVVAAGARNRTTRDRVRFGLLSDLADVADGHLSLEETAARVGGLLVPKFADVCVLDVVHEGGLRRLAVTAAGPDAAEREARLRRRPPTAAPHPGSGSVVASRTAQLMTEVTDELLRQAAHDEDDLALLRSLRMASSVAVPLRARGRTLGALTLMRTEESRRRYTVEDTRFVEVLAGRVALALDNAGLFTELQTMEAQLTTALGSLAEAVTVQNAQGNLIYANQAAADVLGYASPQELLAAAAAGIREQFDAFHEDGTPVQVTDFPGRRVLEGEQPEPLVLRAVDRRTGEQRWRQIKSTAARDSDGHVRMVVNVIADITAVKRSELLQRLLADAGDALGRAENLHDILQRIAAACVPELADWCVVSMPGEHHELQTVAVAHRDPERVALAQRLGEHYPVDLDEPGGTAQVFREGTPQLVNEITDEMLIGAAREEGHLSVLRELGMRAGLAVPMTTPAGTVGVLTLVSAESGRSFGGEDVALASELARLAATAVENARLYTERSRIAHTLQESLLPDDLPALPGCETASLYRPAGDQDRVGGDFYEAFPLGDDAWMLVVGDVTGRGATAAALTGLMRHTLRAIATFTGSATRALDKLNHELVARPRMSLCTAVCVVLRDTAGEAQADIICAGHPLPILVRDGAADYVGAFGPVLGAFAGERWLPVVVPLRPGDILVLYSDGVLDATGAEDRFGPDRLQTVLAPALSAADAVARIEQALADFQVGPQADDTAVLAVQRIAVPGAAVIDPPADGTRSPSPQI
jgi:PAS domain S-box-containing protein